MNEIRTFQLDDGTKYEVQVTGQAEQTVPVLLLHGFTGSFRAWSELINAYPDYQFIAPNLLGHGGTDAPTEIGRYPLHKVADDLAAIVQRFGVSKVNCIGYSMGGRLALAFSLQHPHLIQSLTLVSASAGLATDAERSARIESDRKLAEMISLERLDKFVDYWEQIPLFASQQETLTAVQKQVQREERLSHEPQGLIGSLLGMGTGNQPYYLARLQELRMPVLLVTGDKDTKFRGISCEMAKEIADCQEVIITNAGHAVHLEQATAFGDSVMKFIKEKSLS